MAITDRATIKAICASIIFSTRFKRELEKASNSATAATREDTILLSRSESIREAMEIAETIVDKCENETAEAQLPPA